MAHRLHINDLSTTLGDGERQFTLQTGQWTVASGEVIGLTGPSGTGKTLLLELLGLLRAPDSGTYHAQSDDAENALSFQFDRFWTAPNAMALCAEARAGFFGFVPQSGGLLPFLTVSENVAVTQEIAGRPDAEWHRYLIAALGLEGVAHLRPGALSIGQRQRVAIARALSHRPFCVIADEPTAALDPENAHTAMKLLIDAAQAGGAATLLSSHDYPALAQFPMRRMTLTAHAQNERRVVSTLREEAPNAAPAQHEVM